MQKLQSLPHILTEALSLLKDERADAGSLASLIEQDPALSIRVMNFANSAYFGYQGRFRSARQAVMALGFATIRNLVIAAILQQFFDRFQTDPAFLGAFWRRSLNTGTLARRLAELTRYPFPDEAYLAGLLTETGQLLLLRRDPAAYRALWEKSRDERELLAGERALMRTDHCCVGGDLVDGWSISPVLGEAIRSHMAPAGAVMDAPDLVKIVNLAARLAGGRLVNEETLTDAYLMFGLQEAMVRNILEQCHGRAADLAAQMGIAEAADGLAEQLRDGLESLVADAGSGQGSSQPASLASLCHTLRRSIYALTKLETALICCLDLQGNRVLGVQACQLESGQEATFVADLNAEPGMVAGAILNNHPAILGESPAELDRIFLAHGRSPRLLVIPLQVQMSPVGAIALVPRQNTSALEIEGMPAYSLLISLVAGCLTALSDQLWDWVRAAQAARPVAVPEELMRDCDPVQVLGRYLEHLKALRAKCSGDEDLRNIHAEMERVGETFLRISSPLDPALGGTDVNRMIRQLVELRGKLLPSRADVRVQLNLLEPLPCVNLHPALLQQILLNMLEAVLAPLPAGQVARIETDVDVVSQGGALFSCVSVFRESQAGSASAASDWGEIPQSTLQIQSRSGHQLAILAQLIRENGGKIQCRTDNDAMHYRVFLPA